MHIDIFCHVIDYFGDVAVSYRLARALQILHPSIHIRFFSSHPHLVRELYPDQAQDSIALLSFDEAPHTTHPTDVAIETFACQLPEGYPLPPLIINLEYLTAESWITSYHKQESIGMNPKGKKFFFFPSFTPKGSLTHGSFLKHLQNNSIPQDKARLFTKLNLPDHFHQRPWLLVYLYEIDRCTLMELLEHFAIIAIGHSPLEEEHPWLVARRCSQEDFDTLLIVADHTLIRGEDSLSRAILTGKPFLWQAYRQEDAYHMVKVEALAQHLQTFVHPQLLTSWQTLQIHINQSNTFDIATFIQLPKEPFQQIATTLQHFPSLEQNLYNFILKYQ